MFLIPHIIWGMTLMLKILRKHSTFHFIERPRQFIRQIPATTIQSIISWSIRGMIKSFLGAKLGAAKNKILHQWLVMKEKCPGIFAVSFAGNSFIARKAILGGAIHPSRWCDKACTIDYVIIASMEMKSVKQK